jgi:hypothetical protein
MRLQRANARSAHAAAPLVLAMFGGLHEAARMVQRTT